MKCGRSDEDTEVLNFTVKLARNGVGYKDCMEN